MVEGEFVFATSRDMSDIEELQVFLDDSVRDGTEGLMVKALCDSYEISKRSHSWLKLKKDYLGTGVGDSIDVLIIGAYHGKGKRSGNYGGFLAAIYDPDGEEYQTICKLGTGLKERDLISPKNRQKCRPKNCRKMGFTNAGFLECLIDGV